MKGSLLKSSRYHEVSLEKVDKFCYLGDVLDANEGCVTALVRSARKKCSILTGKGFWVKTERQGVRYLSDVWKRDLAYESRA